VGCGKGAPETDTNYTLISAQFGWRLTRTKQKDGTVTLEWRCPTCWRDFKRSRVGVGTEAALGSHLPEMRPPASGDSNAPVDLEPRLRRIPSAPDPSKRGRTSR
jgi:hypothetical protein